METPVRLSDITAAWWQPALFATGSIAADAADIDQCIKIILTTPIGSDVHRPDFGSKIHNYIDYPQPRAKPFVVKETIEAINRWETRIAVSSVDVNTFQGNDASRLAVKVTWVIPGSDFVSSTEVLINA